MSSIGVKLLQTEFSAANFGNWSFNISLLLCNKCLTDCLFLLKIFHLLTYKPAAWVSHKNSSKRTCSYWLLNFSQYVFVNSKSYFFWKFGLRYDKTISIVFYSNLIYKAINKRAVLTNFDFQVCFPTSSWEELLLFYLSKRI